MGNGRYNFGMTVSNMCNIVSCVEILNTPIVNEMSAKSATEMERSGIGVRYGYGIAHELMAKTFHLVRTSGCA